MSLYLSLPLRLPSLRHLFLHPARDLLIGWWWIAAMDKMNVHQSQLFILGRPFRRSFTHTPWIFEGSAKRGGWGAVPEDVPRHGSHASGLRKNIGYTLSPSDLWTWTSNHDFEVKHRIHEPGQYEILLSAHMVSGSRLLVGMSLMKNSDFHQAGEILGCCQVELKISAAAPSWGLALTYDHRALYRRASVPIEFGRASPPPRTVANESFDRF